MKGLKKRILSALTLALAAAFVVACDGNRNGPGPNDPNDPENQEGPVISQETRANFVEAYNALEQASQGGLNEDECEDVVEEFEEVSEEVPGGLPEAIFNAGMVWDKCGETSKARDYFEKASKIAASTKGPDGEKRSGYALALLKLGIYEYEEGNKTKARRFWDKAREADRRSAEAYTNLSVLQREDEDWGEAQKNVRRALAVNSDYITAFAQMALLYLQVAEKNRRMLDIVELVSQQATSRANEINSDPEGDTKVDPADIAPIHNIWGLALIQKGDVVSSVQQFDTARTLNPNFFEAHMNFGAVNLSFRGFKASEQAFRKAVQLEPKNYFAHLSLGAAQRGLEQYDQARQSYEKARDIDPAAPGAYYNLALLMQDYLITSAGDMNAQIEMLKKAKTVYREFINKCKGKRATECIRKRPGEPDRDLRKAAQKRIKSCDQTISGLQEAQELAREVEQMEAEAQKQQKQQ